MTTISSDLTEGPRPKLHLLDLPQEVKDQIYGYIVCGDYLITRRSQKQRRDDFRQLSILRVSKRTNCEAMQVLQRRSWFIYNLPCWPPDFRAFDNAPNQHMMNVDLIIGPGYIHEHLIQTILSFSGTGILRRTCRILIPNLSLILRSHSRNTTDSAHLRTYFQFFKLLIGFTTVVVQVKWNGTKKRRRDVHQCEESAKLMTDIVEFLEPALGPAMPCCPVQDQRYGMNVRFSPRNFAAERLVNAELGV